MLLSVIGLLEAGAVAGGFAAFENLRIDGGSYTVYSVYEDADGLLYVGTDNGLYVYDGYVAKCAGVSGAFPGGHINAITGLGGLVYLGCDDGVMIFDSSTDSFVGPTGGFPANVRALGVDGDALLLGSFSGLYRYTPGDRRLVQVTAGVGAQSVVYAIAQDAAGNHYIGTYEGLLFLPKGGDKAEPLPLPQGVGRHFFVNSLAFDRSSGMMTVGAEGGLYTYDPGSRTYYEVAGLASNSCKSLSFDESGELWVGTDNGLYVIGPDGQVMHYTHDSRLASTLLNNIVWCVLAHGSSRLWVGTDEGLSSLPLSDDFETIPLYVMTGRGDGNRIDCILLDSKGVLWLGGSNGLIRRDADGESEWYRVDNRPYAIPHNRVRSIFEDSRGRLWAVSDGGVLLYDRATGQFSRRRIVSADGTRNANWAYRMAEDADGRLWVGSYLGGLMAVDGDELAEGRQPCVALQEYSRENGTLPNNFFNQMVSDCEGNHWAIFFRSGEVVRVSARDGSVSRYDFERAAGSPPSGIIASPEDDGVWVACYGGVARLDASGCVAARVDVPTPQPVTILSMANVGDYICIVTSGGIWRLRRATGEIEMLDSPAAGCASVFCDEKSGRVIFGGVDEIVCVSGEMLAVTRSTPRLWLTDIEINGERYRPEGTSVRNLERLTLAYDQGNLSIRFSDLDYGRATRRHYEYRLIGFDSQWTTLDDGVNQLRFLNLHPGSYVLQIRAVGAPSDDVFEFPVTVSQPWFWSWWARTVYFLICAGIVVYVVLRFRRRRLDELERVERETALESVRRRIDFMTNISHEFKTPLSLIIGPLSKLLRDKSASKVRTELEGVYSHAMELNGLIQRAMDIGRVGNCDDVPILSEVDVVELARGVFDNFREAFPEKNFVFSSEVDTFTARLDVLKMESVFNNLVSNACKYSSEQATIALSIEVIDSQLRVTVSDDGVGIPADELQMVFHRLFQSTRTIADGKGTGIGLYMVKKYVEIHGGTIVADNNGAGGARFTITIPVTAADGSCPDEDVCDVCERTGLKKVLVVEDNHAVSRFICGELSDNYECIRASNGRAGLAVLGGVTPDLIIADIMMPVMDGLEMARRIRSNPRFAEVPVILLSAKDDSQTRARAAEVGVTVFMAKPFDASVLAAQVRNLLARTENIRATARRELISEPVDKAVPQSPDEEMLARVAEVIEANMDNAEFSVAMLSEKTGIQSKTLYRLIKKYIGQTPVDYVRTVRLKRAAMLLGDDKFTVAEVMYMVGFSSASYFSKCFSAQFGKTPRQYRAEHAG